MIIPVTQYEHNSEVKKLIWMLFFNIEVYFYSVLIFAYIVSIITKHLILAALILQSIKQFLAYNSHQVGLFTGKVKFSWK